MYRYLAPNDAVLMFARSNLLIPRHDEGTQEIEPLEWGSVIKLYDYEMPGGLKTNIKLDLYYHISLLLPRVGLPIRFYERHGFRLVFSQEKDRLLKTYWSIPERQIETSVVLREQK